MGAPPASCTVGLAASGITANHNNAAPCAISWTHSGPKRRRAPHASRRLKTRCRKTESRHVTFPSQTLFSNLP